MNQSAKKPYIQKRIREWVRKHKWLSTIILVPVICFIVVFVLEIFSIDVLESVAKLMRGLEDTFPEAFKGVVTFLSGAFSFVLGRYIYDEYRKPKLEIVRVDPLSQPDFKSWRVIVKNTGKTAAENCTGSIHLLGKDANKNDIDLEGGVCWSTLGNPNIITLNVEDEQSLDVYSVTFAKAILHFPTEKGWSFYRASFELSEFQSPAQLKLKIRITAKNARPSEKTYLLKKRENDIIMIG